MVVVLKYVITLLEAMHACVLLGTLYPMIPRIVKVTGKYFI